MTINFFQPTQQASGDNAPFIEMHQIVKTFKTPAGEFTALKQIDACFEKGEFVSVVGKSGSGKSTLVNMLSGIDHPTSGSVRIGDTFVHRLNESQMARWRGRNLGIVFQFYQLLPMLSLLENVMLPMDFGETYVPAQRERRAMELLDLVDLASYAHKMPSAVSGGQQQSAAIARALANDPPLIVADEPTGNLDSKAAEAIFQVFEGLAEQGKTIIMVTHDSTLAQRAARTMLLADGELVSEFIAGALPQLSHQQMLHATKHLAHRCFSPGEMVIRHGDRNDTFYVITSGRAEVTLGWPGNAERKVGDLVAGQYFGEMAMLGEGHATANVRAAQGGILEVVALDHQKLRELLDASHAAREAITQVANRRVAQNAAFN